jgi:hypothetical protein
MCHSLILGTVTDLLKALLGNGSVNTFQHTHAVNNTVAVFSMWTAPRNSRRSVFCMVRPTQHRRAVFCVVGARSSRRAVFSAWSLPRLYNGSLFVALISAVQSS